MIFFGLFPMFQSIRARLRAALASLRAAAGVHRVASAPLPTEYGQFRIYVYEKGTETHVALVRGEVANGDAVLTRIHSTCLTGDVFHSARCDCGEQLETALRRIAAASRGVVVYLNQEGRGIGLANKIRAYMLQDEGYDTVEANVRLGFEPDLRDYGIGVQILRDLGVRSIRLLSNNPRKLASITKHGLAVVEMVPLEVDASEMSLRYLRTKKEKLGHRLSIV
jgi:3,4-dihydroxy 2-butanone 4-phosphate synthase/GTP cyclohydrolase II